MWVNKHNARPGSRSDHSFALRQRPNFSRRGLNELELGYYERQRLFNESDLGCADCSRGQNLGYYERQRVSQDIMLDGFNLGKSLKKAVNSVKKVVQKVNKVANPVAVVKQTVAVAKKIDKVANPVTVLKNTATAIRKNPFNPLKQVKDILAPTSKAAQITATITPEELPVPSDSVPGAFVPGKRQRRIGRGGTKAIVAAVPKTDVPLPLPTPATPATPSYTDYGSSGGGGGGGSSSSAPIATETPTPTATTEPEKKSAMPWVLGALALGLSFLG